MAVKNFDDLYIQELRDLYSAERQLVEALPRVAKAATNEELVKAVEEHLEQTKGHVERLEKIFDDLGERPTGHRCKAMEGLVEEGKEVISDVEEGPLRDAALIVGAQKIEHYEIAGYGSARTFAQLLGRDNDVEILQQTLDEESETNESLTELAQQMVNPEAAEETD